jgi:hypothetical protein
MITGIVVSVKLPHEDLPEILCLLQDGVVTPIMRLLQEKLNDNYPSNKDDYRAYYQRIGKLNTILIVSQAITPVLNQAVEVVHFKLRSVEWSLYGYGGEDHNAEESYSGISYTDSIESDAPLKAYLLTQLNQVVTISLITT